VGFFNMLFILLFVVAGYYIGKKCREEKNYFRNLVDRILRRFNI
jgi:uncharacterized membrane protein